MTTSTTDTEHLMACHECDLLFEHPHDVDHGTSTYCPRCNHKIQMGVDNLLDQIIALSLSGLFILLMANTSSFLSFEAKGQGRSINLFNVSQELYVQGFPVLAALIFTVIIAIPAIYLSCLLAIAIPVKFDFFGRAPYWIGWTATMLLPWAMSEVFLMGVLVALIKIAAMAKIVLGMAFWAYIFFAVMFLRLVSIADTHRLWGWVEGEVPEPKK